MWHFGGRLFAATLSATWSAIGDPVRMALVMIAPCRCDDLVGLLNDCAREKAETNLRPFRAVVVCKCLVRDVNAHQPAEDDVQQLCAVGGVQDAVTLGDPVR